MARSDGMLASFSDYALIIRKASLADETTIYAFICHLEDAVLNREAFRSVYERNVINPSIHYLIAEDATHEIVGFASCHIQFLLHHCGQVGEIQELFVRSDKRNQGIGQRLVTELKSIARNEGLLNLEVTTNQKRVDTIRFYEREQFRRTHAKLVYSITTQ